MSDHSKDAIKQERDPFMVLLRRVAGLNRDAGEIGAGMLAQLVDEARRLLAVSASAPDIRKQDERVAFEREYQADWNDPRMDTERKHFCLGWHARQSAATGEAAVPSDDDLSDHTAPAVHAQRAHDGFLIPGHHLDLQISADTGGNGICVDVSLTPAATQLDRGVWLTDTNADAYPPDGITVDGDRLTCSRPYRVGVTDFRQGFSVTLEPGQAHGVRQALAGAQRVLDAYAGAVGHLQPWLNTVQPSAWYVTQPLFQLIVAYVLDAATHDQALAVFDRAVSSGAPSDARLRIADPALWALLKKARDVAPIRL